MGKCLLNNQALKTKLFKRIGLLLQIKKVELTLIVLFMAKIIGILLILSKILLGGSRFRHHHSRPPPSSKKYRLSLN